MKKFILLFLIIIFTSGCGTVSKKEWSIYKTGFSAGVDCRGKLSAPSCMLFLEKMEGLE